MAETPEPLVVTRLAKMTFEDPSADWLIEGLWADRAVGCLGGTPKSCKTWLALEMAVAVASGQPCLGRFAVPRRGPVLLYCAEDGARAIQQRVAGLARARGLDFDRLGIGWMRAEGLSLDEPTHLRRLSATIGNTHPRLVILDPLVRLHRGDENSATAIADLLGGLRELQRMHGTAILLVHHVRKSGASEPGQALRGSGDLHAWGDSNAYLVRREGRLVLVLEHRAHPAPDPVEVRLEGDPPRLVISDVAESVPLDARVLAALAARPLTRSALREQLGVRNETLGESIERLLASKQLIRVRDGLALPVPLPGTRRERNAP